MNIWYWGTLMIDGHHGEEIVRQPWAMRLNFDSSTFIYSGTTFSTILIYARHAIRIWQAFQPTGSLFFKEYVWNLKFSYTPISCTQTCLSCHWSVSIWVCKRTLSITRDCGVRPAAKVPCSLRFSSAKFWHSWNHKWKKDNECLHSTVIRLCKMAYSGSRQKANH